MKSKLLVIGLFLFSTFTVNAGVIQDNQCGSYVPWSDYKATLDRNSDENSMMESLFGKFKSSYCRVNAKQACRQVTLMKVCKINLNQADGSCPDACKAWAKDCKDESTSDMAKEFGEDLIAQDCKSE